MKWLSRFNIGLLSGVALGVLFAPRKGSETQEILANQLGNCRKRVSGWCRRHREDEIAALAEALGDEATEITSEMRQQLIRILRKASLEIEEEV